MNSKRGIAFSIAAIAAATVLFASAPLVANQQVQAFPFGGGKGAGGGGGFGGTSFHISITNAPLKC